MGVAQWVTDGPPPPAPPLKGEGSRTLLRPNMIGSSPYGSTETVEMSRMGLEHVLDKLAAYLAE